MFGRNQSKTDRSAPPSTPEGAEGKGRPTPSRKQAEAERKERLKASSSGQPARGRTRATGPSATKSERAETRKRIIAGDERVLAARDRGPERRYARDLVDERHTVGEYFLYLAIFVLIIGLIRVPAVAVGAQVLLGLIIVGLAADSYFIRRNVTRAVAAKFPEGNLDGIGRYAMTRGMVTRRMRVPGPQVPRRKRGGGSA